MRLKSITSLFLALLCIGALLAVTGCGSQQKAVAKTVSGPFIQQGQPLPTNLKRMENLTKAANRKVITEKREEAENEKPYVTENQMKVKYETIKHLEETEEIYERENKEQKSCVMGAKVNGYSNSAPSISRWQCHGPLASITFYVNEITDDLTFQGRNLGTPIEEQERLGFECNSNNECQTKK